MAYQPIENPILGLLSPVTTGVTPITLALTGVDYVLLAIKFATPRPTAEYVLIVESLSVMCMAKKEIEWRIFVDSVVTGGPLTYVPVEGASVLTMAVGTGAETASGGFDVGQGRFVPGEAERGISRGFSPANDIDVPAPADFVAYLVARPLANNASVSARASIREIQLDENGQPIDRLPFSRGI